MQDKAGKEDWRYYFLLRREPEQASIKEALVHPTADEMDDWKDYQLPKNGPSTALAQSVYVDPDVDIQASGFDEMRRDSGYLSRRPSGI